MHRSAFRYFLVATTMILLFSAGCKDNSGIRPGGTHPAGRVSPGPELREREGEIFPGVDRWAPGDLKRGHRGGTMIRADIEEYDTLNVVTTRSRSLYSVLRLVFESLLSLNPLNGELQGGLASGYEITNDGYSILLHLNEGLRFSDGHPCTVDDVLYTFDEIYMNPDVDSKKADMLKIRDTLVSVSAPDHRTVRFDLPVPYRPFLYTLAHVEILPRHILSPLIEKGGIEAFNREWGSLKGDTATVVGTGPYRIEEYRPGELIRLTRNPNYGKREGSLWLDGTPYLDEIIELLDIDDETKLLKFQIGEIDFYNVKDPDISSGDLENLLTTRQEGRYRLYSGGQTLGSNHFLLFNQNAASLAGEKLDLFKNRLFRKAVSHLIDRTRIVREVYNGYAYLDASPERSVSPFHVQIQPLPYDPDAARALFSQLNMRDIDGDGYLELPSGQPFGFTILTNDDNPFRVKMGSIITESLNEAGVRAQLTPTEYNAIVTKLLDTFSWDAVIIGVEGSPEPNDASWIWESRGPLHIWAPYRETPQTEWEKRIDELFAMGRTTWDIARAKRYYEEYQNIVSEQLPVMNILIPAQLYGFRTDFGNVLPSAVTYNAIGIIPFLYRKHPDGGRGVPGEVRRGPKGG
jgi:peptide/nickel transport system substrate-binding protein